MSAGGEWGLGARRVYRYEHPNNGCGPYTSKRWDDELGCRLCNAHGPLAARRPQPAGDEGLPREGREWWFRNNGAQGRVYCGCESVAALVEWFWGFNAALRRAGYVIAEYEAQRAYVSTETMQVIFDMTTARRCGVVHRRAIKGRRTTGSSSGR